MPNVALFKQDGTQNGEITLNEEIFGIEPNESVVYDAIIMQRASLRQGTHAVKTVALFVAVAANHGVKRNWSCSSRFNPFTTMAWRWRSLWTNTAFMQLQTSKKFVA